MFFFVFLACAPDQPAVVEGSPFPEDASLSTRRFPLNADNPEVRFDVDPTSTHVSIEVFDVDGLLGAAAVNVLEAPIDHDDTLFSGSWPRMAGDAVPSGSWTLGFLENLEMEVEVVVQERTRPVEGPLVLHADVLLTRSLHDEEVRNDVEVAIAVWREEWSAFGIELVAQVRETDASSHCGYRRAVENNSVAEQGADHDITILVCNSINRNAGTLGQHLMYHSPALSVAAITHRRPEAMAQTMAHEVGHAAGLDHTDFHQFDDVSEDGDYGNLMYPGPVCSFVEEGFEDDLGCWRQWSMSQQQEHYLKQWVAFGTP